MASFWSVFVNLAKFLFSPLVMLGTLLMVSVYKILPILGSFVAPETLCLVLILLYSAKKALGLVWKLIYNKWTARRNIKSPSSQSPLVLRCVLGIFRFLFWLLSVFVRALWFCIRHSIRSLVSLPRKIRYGRVRSSKSTLEAQTSDRSNVKFYTLRIFSFLFGLLSFFLRALWFCIRYTIRPLVLKMIRFGDVPSPSAAQCSKIEVQTSGRSNVDATDFAVSLTSPETVSSGQLLPPFVKDIQTCVKQKDPFAPLNSKSPPLEDQSRILIYFVGIFSFIYGLLSFFLTEICCSIGCSILSLMLRKIRFGDVPSSNTAQSWEIEVQTSGRSNVDATDCAISLTSPETVSSGQLLPPSVKDLRASVKLKDPSASPSSKSPPLEGQTPVVMYFLGIFSVLFGLFIFFL